jgi:hypothetical protein
LIIIRIAVFHDLSWFDIHICNYLSLSKDRKMSLWPSYFTIDIENKHSYNLNDKYLQDWLKSIEKHKLCCVKKAVKEIKNITGTLAFWPMTLKIRYTSCSLNGWCYDQAWSKPIKKAVLSPLGYTWKDKMSPCSWPLDLKIKTLLAFSVVDVFTKFSWNPSNGIRNSE